MLCFVKWHHSTDNKYIKYRVTGISSVAFFVCIGVIFTSGKVIIPQMELSQAAIFIIGGIYNEKHYAAGTVDSMRWHVIRGLDKNDHFNNDYC